MALSRDYFAAFHTRYVAGINATDDAVLGLLIRTDALTEVVDLIEKRGDLLQERIERLEREVSNLREQMLTSHVDGTWDEIRQDEHKLRFKTAVETLDVRVKALEEKVGERS
ncbi:MAG: hypothetical protein ABFC96_15710 [Thermoguttaceae bacterium]